MTKYTISIPLIVRNEESCLDRCLSSFQPIANEFIIVDTGSTDRTKEIARKYTDKIFDFPWIDDFSAARNFSFDKCSGDFIFWVDADDQIYPEDIEKFRAIDLSDKEIIICNYEYCHDEFGKSIMTVPRERIIKRSLGVRWQEPIHEYLPINHKIFISDISTHHFKKAGSSERNLRILERIVQKPGCISRNFYYLGRECLDFGRVEEGVKYLTKYIEMGDGFWEDVCAAHYRLAEAYIHKDEALFKHHLFKSLEIEERRSEPYFLMAQYWESKKQWQRAIQWYEFCTVIKRPKDLLAYYQPDFYTWKPCLQLCLCYNNMGNLEKALEWNNKALQYRPQDKILINNKNILLNGISEKAAKEKKKDGQGKKLNLGCGGKKEPGYVNVDLFAGPAVDEIFELDDIPYADGTIAGIHSEHALEHLGWARAEKALKEWHRVLQPGGEVILYMPDVELCFKSYLEAPLEAPNFYTTRAWYKFTVYGIQTSQGGEPDDAQTHRCGFSKEEIAIVMERNGFIVNSVENYGGPGQKPSYGTPSMAIRAVKPVSNLKIGWIGRLNLSAAQTRIRVHAVDRWLRSKGYWSKIVSYNQIVENKFDIVIVGKSFSENDYNSIKWLKEQGKRVICDLCENLVGWPWVNEILSLCDTVVCCSTELARVVKEQTGCNVEVIEDAYESGPNPG
jgi:glycosyltransferase involved in cell wall biosynthesis/predicted SAM-dependent methyltransferase